jgi:hypothetical protein
LHKIRWVLINAGKLVTKVCSLFARLISHQPAVLFSQNEPATSNQPQPASSTLLSEQTSTSHEPPANRTGCWSMKLLVLPINHGKKKYPYGS